MKKLKAQAIQRMTNKITAWAIDNQTSIRQRFKEEFKGTAWVVDGVGRIREYLGRGGVMSEAERALRITSLILGIRSAQRAGLIKEGIIYELPPGERELAIEYGRKATNLMFDFGMSKQSVGESYRGALGALGGQFSVWKSQKAASDLTIIQNAAAVFNDNNTPTSIVKAFYNALRYDADTLERVDPDGAKLRRFLLGQFLIEGLTQVTLSSAFLPGLIGQTAASTLKWGYYSMGGSRGLSAGGSPVAGMIWGATIFITSMAMKAFGEDPWDDEKDLERFVSHQFRNIPGVGVGEGAIYDATSILLLYMAEQESLANEKLAQATSYGIPFPIIKEVPKKIIKSITKPTYRPPPP
jgi:hypothetical protein